MYFFAFYSYIDSIHRVKSEQDKNDDEGDVTDDERKAHHNMLRHHAVMPHQSYYQHSMFSHHFKQEIDPKNQTESDCGVSIPASKPKIWSLADTAACKTPPPSMHHHHHHHLQQQSYNNINNDQWTTNNNNNTINNYPTNYHQLNHSVQHLDHQSLQQLHQHHLHNSSHPVGDNPMQMMTNFVQSAQNSTSNMSMESDMSITPSSEDIQVEAMNGNHNNSMYSRYGGMTAHQHYHSPLGVNSTEISMTAARQAQISSMQKHHTGTNQTMGFPEIQTDTPPQTPPNMKLPIAALTPTTGTCFNNNNNNNGNSHNIVNSQSPNINNKSPLKNGGESTYVENFHISTSNTTAISRSAAVDSLQKKQHHIQHEYNNNNNQQMVTENNNDMNTSDSITRNELTANGFKSFYKK